MARSKYGYIYMIVNKVNGKTYVGKHKLPKGCSTCYKDRYMGSGVLLKPAQKKYGIENFEKLLIQYTDSEKEAREREKFWIAEYRSRGMAQYNIADGGEGGSTMKGKKNPKSLEARKKISNTVKKRWAEGAYDSVKRSHTAWNKGRKLPGSNPHNKDWCEKISNAKFGHEVTEDCRNKIAKTLKEKNRHWYTNGTESILTDVCPEGFWRGRIHRGDCK